MSVTIAPNDANLLYSPHTWDRTSVRALTVNNGAYLRAAFLGTPTAMTFDMSAYGSELAQVCWRIDGGPWSHAVVAASMPLTMPSDESWPRHVVELVVKSNSQVGSRWNFALTNAVRFTGFTAADGVTTLPVQRRPLTVLVHGDSITEGLRTLGATNPNPTFDSDATRSWAWLVGDTVGAEVGVVGFAGQGWTSPGSGFVPAFPDAWDLLYEGKARPVLDPAAPDVILINLGTNDQSDVTTVATATLTEMLAAYPTGTRIVVMRPFHGDQAAALAAAVAAVANPRLTYLDTTGWWDPATDAPTGDGTHPLGFSAITQIAPRLASAVRGALAGADRRWVKTPAGALVNF